MKRQAVLFIGLFVLSLTFHASAQRGVGKDEGIVRSGEDVEMKTIEGTITQMKEGPCENTTGRSVSGTHIFVDDESMSYNVHLGPTNVVKRIIPDLETMKKVRVIAFRTSNHSEKHYVAQKIIAEGKEYILRESNLRPVWAGNKGKRQGRNRRW